METSGSSAGKDSLGKETCRMAANSENSPCESERHWELGAWLGEDGWGQGGRQRGAGSGRGGSWGQEGCGMDKSILQRLLSREQPEMAPTAQTKSKIQLPKNSKERILK